MTLSECWRKSIDKEAELKRDPNNELLSLEYLNIQRNLMNKYEEFKTSQKGLSVEHIKENLIKLLRQAFPLTVNESEIEKFQDFLVKV